ncbi:MAG: hypothetical protein HY721_24525 [Planctomycetes bacterium]|nr:hypothetical protein [Planctomycetota bacterium]
MSLSINYPDKIIAGLNQSYTVVSDEGPPKGKVQVDGKDVPHRVIPLGAPKDSKVSTTPVMKYKVTFLIPQGSAGKSLVLQLQAGSSKVEETKPITES